MTRGKIPSDTIPQHMRGFVGDSLEIRQVEAWEAPAAGGRRIGTVVIEISGAPVRLTGTRRITPSADGKSCTDQIEGELKAAVPLRSEERRVGKECRSRGGARHWRNRRARRERKKYGRAGGQTEGNRCCGAACE